MDPQHTQHTEQSDMHTDPAKVSQKVPLLLQGGLLHSQRREGERDRKSAPTGHNQIAAKRSERRPGT